MTTTLLGSVFTTAAGAKTVTLTPALSDLIILVVANTGYTGTTLPTDNNSDGLGTYTLVNSSVKATSADTMQVYVRNALIGSATSTVFTSPGASSSGGGVHVVKITGTSSAGTGAIRQSAIQSNQASGGTPTPVFSPAALTASTVIGAVFNATTTAATMTPRTGYSELADVGYSTPTTGIEVMSRDTGETGTSIAWGSTSSSAFCSIALEVINTPSSINVFDSSAVTESVSLGGKNPATLAEDWISGSISAAKWVQVNSAQISVVSAQLNIATLASATSYNAVESLDFYDLTGKQITTQVVNAGNQSLASHETLFYAAQDGTNTGNSNKNKLYFSINAGNLIAYKFVNSAQTSLASIAYNSTTMQYLRLRESGGTFFWDYAADGQTWTNLTSAANPFSVTTMYVAMQAGTFSSELSGTTSIFDNFNSININTFETVAVADAAMGNQLSFDGNGWVDFGDLALTSGTVEMWINPSTITGDIRLFSQTTGATTQAGATAINQIAAETGSIWVWDGTTWQRLCAASTLATSTNYLLDFVFSGGNCTLYVNGVQKTTVASAFAFNGVHFGLAQLYVGANGTRFQGKMDEVRVYSTPLSGSTITAHYNNGNGIYGTSSETGIVTGYHFDEGGGNPSDYSGNGHTGTLSGTTVPTYTTSTLSLDSSLLKVVETGNLSVFDASAVTENITVAISTGVASISISVFDSSIVFESFNSALTFNGSTQSGTWTSPARTAGQPFSVVSWIKKTNSNAGAEVVIGARSGDTAGLVWKLEVNNNKAGFQYDPTGSGGSTIGTSTVNNGLPHVLIGVYDGSSITVYVDGSAQGTPVTSKPSAAITTTSGTMGARVDFSAEFFTGTIGASYTFTRALSSAEISSYSSTGKLDLTSCYSAWLMSDGSGTTVTDRLNAHNVSLTNTPSWVSGIGYQSGKVVEIDLVSVFDSSTVTENITVAISSGVTDISISVFDSSTVTESTTVTIIPFLSVVNLTSGGSASGATSYTTASISPAANTLILAGFASRTGISTNPTQPTLTGCSLTWDVVGSVVYDDTSTSRKRLTLFRSMGASPTTGTLTFDEGGQSQTSASWVVDQWTGVDQSGTNGSGAVAQFATAFDDTGANAGKTLTVTLAAFSSIFNATYGVFADDGSGITVGSGFTQTAQGTNLSATGEYKLTNSTSVGITDAASTSELGGIAIEVRALLSSTPFAINTSDSSTVTENFGVVRFKPNLMPSYDHIVVIVMENTDYTEIIGNTTDAPYINNTLLALSSSLTNIDAITHPSLPNYLALTSGSTQGTSTDFNIGPPDNHALLNAKNLADFFDLASVSWKAYIEAMPSDWYTKTGRTMGATGTTDFAGNQVYDEQHNPWIYFQDNNDTNANPRLTKIVPYTQFATDLAVSGGTGLPKYAWITPQLDHDMHDAQSGTVNRIKAGDNWLSTELAAILTSDAYTLQNTLVILTWDEADTDVANRIPTLILGKNVMANHTSGTAFTLYNILSTIEYALGPLPTFTTNDDVALLDVFAKTISVSDSSTVTDAISQVLEKYNVSVFDSSTVTENVSITLPTTSYSLSVFDSSTVTNVVTQILEFENINVFDSSAVTDVLTQILETDNISVFDSSAVTDVLVQEDEYAMPFVVDSSTVTENTSVILSISGISVFDSSAVTDVLTQILQTHNASVFDASTVTDVISQILEIHNISVLDSSTATDVITQILEFENISVFDSSSVSESSTVAFPGSNTLTISVTEDSTVVDKVFYYDDTVFATEFTQTQIVADIFTSLSDSSAATDVLTQVLETNLLSIFESSTVTNVLTQILETHNISVFDSSLVLDVLVQDTEDEDAVTADSTTVTEIVSVTVSISGISVFDSSAVTNVLSQILETDNISVSDSSAVTDVVIAIYYPPQVSDSSTVTDALVQILQTYTISVFDASTVTNILTQILEIDNVSVFDTSAVTDVVTALYYPPQISDSSTVTDLVTNIFLATAVSIFDSSAVTESVTVRVPTYLISKTEDSVVTDVLLLDYYNETYAVTPVVGSLQGTANWNVGGYVQLTPIANNQLGEVNYNGTLPSPLEVKFDFWTGGGSGADAVYFYWGASRIPLSEIDTTGGYAVVFDEWVTKNQPYIINFNGATLANTTGTATFGDSTWHTAKITYVGTTVTISLDNVQVLNFTDTSRVLGGNYFGLAGRTGGTNNEHRVRNFQVSTYNNILEIDNISVFDASALTDTLIAIDYPPSVSDSSAATDVLTQILQTHNISVFDTSIVTDILIQNEEDILIFPVDVSTVTENTTVVLSISGISVFDTSTVTNVISQVLEIENISAFDASTVTNIILQILEIGNVSVFDASVVTDVVTQIIETHNISIFDASTVTDVVTNILQATGINTFDASGVFDSVAVVLPNYYISPFDASIATENLTLVENENIAVFNSSTVTDVLSQVVEDNNPVVFDQTAVDEIVFLLLTDNISVSDSSTATENIFTVVTHSISVFNASAVTDVLLQALETDNISVFDSSLVLDVVIQETEDDDAVVADSSIVTESISLILSIPGISVFDASIVTENTQILETDNLSVFDASTVTNVLTQILESSNINTFETSNLTDSATLLEIHNISVFDSSTVTDVLIAPQIAIGTSVSDSSTVTDVVSQVLETDNLSVFDASVVANVLSQILEIDNLSVFDISTVTDVLVQDSEDEDIVVTESTTVTESISLILSAPTISVVDTSTVTEFVSIGYSSFASVFDNTTATDILVQAREDSSIATSDSTTVTDVVTTIFVNPLFLSVFDTSTVTEFVNAIGNKINVTVADTSNVTDTLNGQNGGIYLNPIDLNVFEFVGPYQFIFVDGRLAVRLFANFYTFV